MKFAASNFLSKNCGTGSYVSKGIRDGILLSLKSAGDRLVMSFARVGVSVSNFLDRIGQNSLRLRALHILIRFSLTLPRE